MTYCIQHGLRRKCACKRVNTIPSLYNFAPVHRSWLSRTASSRKYIVFALRKTFIFVEHNQQHGLLLKTLRTSPTRLQRRLRFEFVSRLHDACRRRIIIREKLIVSNSVVLYVCTAAASRHTLYTVYTSCIIVVATLEHFPRGTRIIII